MSAAVILRQLRERGMSLEVLPDLRILVRPSGALTDEDRALIRQHRAELVAHLTPPLPEALAAVIHRVCSLRGDSPAQRAALLADARATPAALQVDLFEHFSEWADLLSRCGITPEVWACRG